VTARQSMLYQMHAGSGAVQDWATRSRYFVHHSTLHSKVDYTPAVCCCERGVNDFGIAWVRVSDSNFQGFEKVNIVVLNFNFLETRSLTLCCD
jgi:hypothetical protein